MSCVLRAGGTDFDIDAFLRDSPLAPCLVFRRGESRLSTDQPNAPRHQRSGFNVDVSDADFGEFEQQSRDALHFLLTHQAEIERLAHYAGVEGIELDFAVNRSDEKFVESYVFAPDLLVLIGVLGLKLSLSCYNQLSSSSADDEDAATNNEGASL